MVLDYAVPQVYGEATSYIKYLYDRSNLAVPLELPKINDRDYKELHMDDYFNKSVNILSYNRY